MPKISIIMPTYNVEKYFAQCLDSILESTLEDIEIIPVDDGSKDSCGKIMDDYAAKDSRVKPIHKENGGYGKAVNVGMDAAQGEYISIIETDDWIDPQMFEKLYAAAKESEADCIKGNFYHCPKPDVNIKHNFFDTLPIGKSFVLSEHPEILMLAPSIWSALYKKSFLLENNIRCVETPGASYQDLPFAFEVYSRAKSILLVDEPFYYYRCEEGQNSSTIRSDRKLFAVVDQIQHTIDMMKAVGSWECSKEAVYKHIYNGALLFIGNAHKDLKKELFNEFCKFFNLAESDNIKYTCFNKRERNVVKAMLSFDYNTYRKARILNYIKKHPLFLFRQDFWTLEKKL